MAASRDAQREAFDQLRELDEAIRLSGVDRPEDKIALLGDGHIFQPDFQSAGDCVSCGFTQESHKQ